MKTKFKLFFLDRNYCRAVYGAMVMLSLLYASLNLMVFERGKVRVFAECVLLSTLVMFAGILLRPARRTLQPAEIEQIPEPRNPFSALVLLLVALVVGGALQTGFVTRVQAVVLAARFAGLDQGIASFPLNPQEKEARLRSQFNKLTSLANVSYRYQIPVKQQTLASSTMQVRNALSRPGLSQDTKEAAWAAYGSLSGLAAAQETLNNKKPVERSGFVINSPLVLQNQKVGLVGQRSALLLNAEIFIENSVVTFDGIDLLASQPFFEGFEVGPHSSVVVRNSRVENLGQTLDGVTWINVEFHHSMIQMKGGPFTLVSVRFVDCDLRWLHPTGPEGGEAGLELRQRITEANGQPITFAYQPLKE